VSTTESGDKTFSSYHGTASVKDGKPEDAHGAVVLQFEDVIRIVERLFNEP
jgi:hypothetical protein